ncbi:5-formyltetrahydrofolate cyclo-ligase [Caulobacter henricii]|uniref:5-formyltetrahydrofolate cyclo-ligase n=1 Tax=Caulobacter henricii TaxID=69395 RepID=A0A0P0P200_9CAUL|nr:5-formyltetrahydrofolate cyclo-ligase [Caulobacter henricii]ALL14568.1 5-formyltetrahydrofolate cyclo-ligase [Caulobacter henricii]
MTLTDPASAKAALRMFVRTRRKILARELPQAAWMAAEVGRAPLAARFPQAGGQVAALYQGLGSELSTHALADNLAEAGWTLALPSVEGEVGRMVFRIWDRARPLVRDAIGLQAPGGDQAVVEPDLVVVPLLAFDRQGRRLGQGGGYYDRALEGLKARRDVFALGLAYSGQQTANLPHEPHDQALDAILTEKEYIAVKV